MPILKTRDKGSISPQIQAILGQLKQRKKRKGAIKKVAKRVALSRSIKKRLAKPVKVSARDVTREIPSAAGKVGKALLGGRFRHGFVPKFKKKRK